MRKRFFVSKLLLLGAALALVGAARASAALAWHATSFDHVLGTSLELKFETRSAADAAAAEKAALAEIDRLAAILSSYDATSEFSRWVATQGTPVPVSPELYEVLALFDAWRERTAGALDASAETAGRLWQTAAQRQTAPSSAELTDAVKAMQQTHWRLDPAHHTATHLTAAPLRLNSFAKSYIIEHACTAALQTGKVNSAVVDIGGDLVIRGSSSSSVAIADPLADAENDEPIAHLVIRDRVIATSGDYRRGLRIGGQWYSHLIDPRTARPAEQVRSATVISRSATDAGALATALAVMPPAEGISLARSFTDTDYLLVLADGSRLTSAGWSELVAPTTAGFPGVHGAMTAASSGNAARAANDSGGAEVLLNLEVASVGGGRARRPYVAVWIEDKDHIPVRTLALWYKGARWLPELRGWNRAEQLRSMAEGSRNPESISSATRGPGKYSLRWDGKDDAGKILPAGTYTIMVEAAREHGTHQLVSGVIDTAGKPARTNLPANAELSAVSFEVRPRSESR